jgi:hypothetical protein
MAASIVGSIIAMMATSALILTIESIEKTYSNAGRYPLKTQEKQILINAQLNTEQNRNKLIEDLNSFPQKY